VRSRKRELDEAMEFVKEQVNLMHLDQGMKIFDVVVHEEDQLGMEARSFFGRCRKRL